MGNTFVLQCSKEGEYASSSIATIIMEGFESEIDCGYFWGANLCHKAGLEPKPFYVITLEEYLERFRLPRFIDHLGYARIITKDGTGFLLSEISELSNKLVTSEVTFVNVFDSGPAKDTYPNNQQFGNINDMVSDKLMFGKRPLGTCIHIHVDGASDDNIINVANLATSKGSQACLLMIYDGNCRFETIRTTEAILYNYNHRSILMSDSHIYEVKVVDDSISFVISDYRKTPMEV